MNCTLGIDPGKYGALVLLNTRGKISGFKMMPLSDEKPIIGNYALGNIKKLIREEFPAQVINKVFVEIPQMFGIAATSSFVMGYNWGKLEDGLGDLEVMTTFITPSEWTRSMHADCDPKYKPKEKSAQKFESLWGDWKPNNFSSLNKQQREGVVDAALIAEYGRKHHGKK